MSEVPLPALEGTNPLGFLAALGVLDALSAACPAVTLKWTDDLVPHVVIGGIPGVEDLLDILDKDRAEWTASALLAFRSGGEPLPDAKPAVPSAGRFGPLKRLGTWSGP